MYAKPDIAVAMQPIQCTCSWLSLIQHHVLCEVQLDQGVTFVLIALAMCTHCPIGLASSLGLILFQNAITRDHLVWSLPHCCVLVGCPRSDHLLCCHQCCPVLREVYQAH